MIHSKDIAEMKGYQKALRDFKKTSISPGILDESITVFVETPRERRKSLRPVIGLEKAVETFAQNKK